MPFVDLPLSFVCTLPFLISLTQGLHAMHALATGHETRVRASQAANGLDCLSLICRGYSSKPGEDCCIVCCPVHIKVPDAATVKLPDCFGGRMAVFAAVNATAPSSNKSTI